MIREYTFRDLKYLVAMHQQQGIDYELPNLNDGMFFSKLVAEADGQPQMAILSRWTTEEYLLMNPHYGTPQKRWELFRELHDYTEQDVAKKGFEDAHCWIPPVLAKRFARRLESLGWFKEPWPSYCKSLHLKPETAAQLVEAA